MQIELSQDEYKTLLGILEISDWVLFGHHNPDPEDRKKFRDFEQKIFGYAKEMGFEDLIEYDSKLQEYLPTQKHDDNSEVMPFIQDYDNISFWEELKSRLALRDSLRKYGQAKLNQMSDEDQFRIQRENEDKYQTEFEKYGVTRLEIKHRR